MDINRPATHIKYTQILGQLRPRQNPFNLLQGKPVRELFKFIYLSSSKKNTFANKQNSKIQLISSAQNSLKTVPTLPQFLSLEAENMYCPDTDCTEYIVQVPYGLYGFSYKGKDFTKKKLKNFSRTACSSQH